MATFLHGVPDFVYRNAKWFFYLSNQLEMDRIRAETQAHAVRAARSTMDANRARQGMQNKLRLPVFA